MFNITEKRFWILLVSAILTVLGIAALVVSTVRLGLPLRWNAEANGGRVATAGGVALLAALVITCLFAWWAFRSRPNSIRYGLCAVLVLLHNLLITGGFYALMGMLAKWEADGSFFAAAIAIAGLSTQSVLTILHRIAENGSRRKETYRVVVNRSVLEAIAPLLGMRLALLFVTAAILLFGGATFRPLAATLLVGTLAETYAAVFFAAAFLAAWERAAVRRAETGATIP